MVGVGMLFYSFVACFYLYRPKFVGVANYKLHIASCRFGGFRRRLAGIEYACGLMWHYLSFYWDWVFIHRIGNYKQISNKERVIYKLKKEIELPVNAGFTLWLQTATHYPKQRTIT